MASSIAERRDGLWLWERTLAIARDFSVVTLKERRESLHIAWRSGCDLASARAYRAPEIESVLLGSRAFAGASLALHVRIGPKAAYFFANDVGARRPAVFCEFALR